MSDKNCLQHQVYRGQGGYWYGRFVRNKLDSVPPDSTWSRKHVLSLKRNGRGKGTTRGNAQNFSHSCYVNYSAWIWYCLWDCGKHNTHSYSTNNKTHLLSQIIYSCKTLILYWYVSFACLALINLTFIGLCIVIYTYKEYITMHGPINIKFISAKQAKVGQVA